MLPLVDGDILVYEAAYACEDKSSDDVLDVLTHRIETICERVEATEPPLIFLTGKGNFRDNIAKRQAYKGNRDGKEKPFHYNNARAFLKGRWKAEVVDGMEADDMLCIMQNKDTIICTRDKDLLQCPGRHYRWETSRVGERFITTDELGYLDAPKKGKLTGAGYKFFGAQVLMGDAADYIPGLPRYGPVKAYKLLCEADSCLTVDGILRQEYTSVYGDEAEEQLMEQINLLWMVRELDEEGKPILWNGESYV